MKKACLLSLGLIILLMGCGSRQELRIYSPHNMFTQEIIAEFERETGIRVRQVKFSTYENMISGLQADRRGRYNLVITDAFFLDNMVLESLALRIDRSKLANYRNINPAFQGLNHDPADNYTIPFGANYYTVVYNPGLTGISIRSYLDLWHPVLAGQVGITDNFRVINGMSLKIMGESPNTNNLAPIRTAGELLRLLIPNISLISDEKRPEERLGELVEELVSGRISAAIMSSAQITQAKKDMPGLQVVNPLEGLTYNLKAAFIPSNAANPGAAYAFLNFILEPRRGAGYFENLGYFSTFSASDPYISEGFRDFLSSSRGFGLYMEAIQQISPEAESLQLQNWTELKLMVN